MNLYFSQSYEAPSKRHRTVKKYILLTIAAVLLVIGLLPLRLNSIQEVYHAPEVQNNIPLREGYSDRLAESVTHKTISQHPKMLDTAAFDAFGKFLRANFPLTFSQLQVDTFSSHTYLLHWQGNAPAPHQYLFLAHQDVVPADPKTANSWKHPPFSGHSEDSLIYGRGTLDDKSSVLALLEGIENLLTHGFQPNNDLFFCFGQDEEIGGRHGAYHVATSLRRRGIRFNAILDEGGIISTGSVPGLEDVPVALIGTAEKGYMSVEITFEEPGGHSSMPNNNTAITQASLFIQSLQNGLFPPTFSPPLQGFITHLAPEMPYAYKILFAALPVSQPLITKVYQKSNTGRALTNNTAVATMMSAGIKDNVIPGSSRVICNTRILPGTRIEDILNAYDNLAKPFGGTVTQYGHDATPATATSSTQSPEFIALGQCVTELYPNALISPYLTIGGTDSKHFTDLSDQIYRFLPITLSPTDLPRIHGVNERIGQNQYAKMISWYTKVLQRWALLS